MRWITDIDPRSSILYKIEYAMISAKTFRQLALAFSQAEEHPHFEKSSFRIKKKIFATLDEKKSVAVVKLSPIDQSAFCAFDAAVIFPIPGSWGKQGWTMINLKKIKVSTLKDALSTAYATVLKNR